MRARHAAEVWSVSASPSRVALLRKSRRASSRTGIGVGLSGRACPAQRRRFLRACGEPYGVSRTSSLGARRPRRSQGPDGTVPLARGRRPCRPSASARASSSGASRTAGTRRARRPRVHPGSHQRLGLFRRELCRSVRPRPRAGARPRSGRRSRGIVRAVPRLGAATARGHRAGDLTRAEPERREQATGRRHPAADSSNRAAAGATRSRVRVQLREQLLDQSPLSRNHASFFCRPIRRRRLVAAAARAVGSSPEAPPHAHPAPPFAGRPRTRATLS
jgi:hypothetical protein